MTATGLARLLAVHGSPFGDKNNGPSGRAAASRRTTALAPSGNGTMSGRPGVKGHRPTVGTRDNKDLVYVFGVVDLVRAAVHANSVARPKGANKKTGLSETGRMPAAFADHLRHVGRMCPGDRHPEVVLLIDNAPWHRGTAVDEASAANPHVRFFGCRVTARS